MAGLGLFCMGRPVLELDGKPIKLEMRKSLALLVYLRLSEGDCSRESLAALFWPEFDQRHAQANLRRALSSLHASLGPGMLDADREKIGLADRSLIGLDVDAFHTHLAAAKSYAKRDGETSTETLAALEDAIRLYRGDFLEGFNMADCPGFDEWQLVQRESLQQELALALQQAAEGSIARSQWDTAIVHARRWVGLDRLHEPAQRFLISLYARSGQRSAALRQFKELEVLLREELGQAAAEETLQLYRSILKGPAAAPEAASGKQMRNGPPPAAVEPLLKTKLYLPISRGKKARRKDLVRKLDGIKEHALTLVSAPAGFGKTTALIEWLDQSSLPAGWVSLDHGDNDPIRLLMYLSAALESVQAGAGDEAMELLRTSQNAPPQFILATLIHALEETTPEPYVLVLDDYQAITDQAAQDVIAFLVDHQPAGMHLVISTRVDPPLGLSRLRMGGQLLEVRTDDLRFNLQEAAEFLNPVMGLKLTRENIASLSDRTEGWIAGLQMAAISLRGRADLAHAIRQFSGSNRYILDYLVEEIIDQQSEKIQEFLLKTSILDKLCAPLCDALLQIDKNGRPVEPLAPSPASSSQAILEFLDRSNLFLIPLDDERRWYRYHHLFADLLRARLRGLYPIQEDVLHTRAAEWYESNHNAADAIRHALAAKDTDQAARLIEGSALEAVNNGEYVTVLGWMQELPAECFIDRPWLCIRYAWAILQSGRIEGVSDLIQEAENSAQGVTDEALPEIQHLQWELLTLRVILASLSDDHVHTIALSRQALDQIPTDQIYRRVNVLYSLGNATYITGDLPGALQVYQEVKSLADQTGFLLRIILASNKLAHIQHVLGHPGQAYEIYQEILDYVTGQGKPGFLGMGFIYCGMGELLYEWDYSEEALEKIREGMRIDELGGVPSMLTNSYALYARLLILQGDLDVARTLLLKARQLIQNYPTLPEVIELNEACWVRYWLAHGDLSEASEWAAERQAQARHSTGFGHELGEMALARVRLAEGLPAEAASLLAQLAQAAEAGGRNGRLIEILVLQALAAQKQNREQEASSYLTRSLLLAEPEGYIRIFADEGQPLERLVQAGLEKKRWNEPRILKYVERLLTALRLPTSTS